MAKGGFVPSHFMLTLTVDEGEALRSVLEDIQHYDRESGLVIRADDGPEREFHLLENEDEVITDLIGRLENRGDPEESLVS